MNQFKKIFGLPITFSHNLPVKGSSISRSTGNNGRDPTKSREIIVATGDSEKSPDPSLSGRSYARIIADYSRAIEGRNVGSKCNGDSKSPATKSGFFSKTPLERLARVSSLVKIRNGGNNGGPSLSTRSSSTPPPFSTKTSDNFVKTRGILDETEVLKNVTQRADWLDRVVKAHKAKRVTRNDNSSNDHDEKNLATLMQRTGQSISRVNSNEYSDIGDRGSSPVKKIPGGTKVDGQNLSVTVKPLLKSDSAKNELLAMNSEDKRMMLVTVTEESKSSSSSLSSLLRHIDLRINGKPAMEMGAVISKIEKLDVVSSAEKIEITIPIVTDIRATVGNNQSISNSTINLCISTNLSGVEGSSSDGNMTKVGHLGESGSSKSPSNFARPSSFFVTKNHNVRKTDDSLSKVVPWWTTVESFRSSETISAHSSQSATTVKQSETRGVREVAAARVSCQVQTERNAKEIAISNAKTRMEKIVNKPSSPRERLKTRRKGTSTAISRIIVNELRKKSKGSRDNDEHRVTVGESGLEAKLNNRVNNTTSNDAKKATTSSAAGGTMEGKSDQTIVPTLDKATKKVSATESNREEEPRVKSMTGLVSSEGNVKNDNLSSANNSKGSIRLKPITSIAKNNDNSKTGRENGTSSTEQILKAGESVGSKMALKPRQGVAFKSKIKGTPQLPRTYGNVKLFPPTQSHPKSVNRANNLRSAFIKPNDKPSNKSQELSSVKNPIVNIRPIEKKKDGTLIDYGLTVSTRKKPERKLLDSQGTATLGGKKMEKKDEPTVTATIKEVIPKSDRDVRSSSINQAIINPSTSKQNGPDKDDHLANEMANRLRDPCKQKNPISKLKPNNAKDLTLSSKKIEKNSKAPSESKIIEATSPEKKLLYSAWLRNRRGGQDPNSSKDPRDS